MPLVLRIPLKTNKQKTTDAIKTSVVFPGGELGIRTLGTCVHSISSAAPSTTRTTLRIQFSLVILTDIFLFVNDFLERQRKKKQAAACFRKIRLSVVDKFCEFNGINDFAVLVNTHVTGSDFVDEDNFVVVVAEFELDIPKIKTD